MNQTRRNPYHYFLGPKLTTLVHFALPLFFLPLLVLLHINYR